MYLEEINFHAWYQKLYDKVLWGSVTSLYKNNTNHTPDVTSLIIDYNDDMLLPEGSKSAVTQCKYFICIVHHAQMFLISLST